MEAAVSAAGWLLPCDGCLGLRQDVDVAGLDGALRAPLGLARALLAGGGQQWTFRGCR